MTVSECNSYFYFQITNKNTLLDYVLNTIMAVIQIIDVPMIHKCEHMFFQFFTSSW